MRNLFSAEKWGRWWNDTLPEEEEIPFDIAAVALVYCAGLLTGLLF